MDEIKGLKTFVFIGIVIVMLLVVFCIFGVPALKPWWSSKSGQAELAQAEQNRQIAILEAKAKMESAELLAQAEVKRAEGVAQANKIIGQSLKENEDYLRYLYINGLVESDVAREIIYIPTEAGLPILEAKR